MKKLLALLVFSSSIMHAMHHPATIADADPVMQNLLQRLSRGDRTAIAEIKTHVEAGADINTQYMPQRGVCGMTALMIAVSILADVNFSRWLVENNADVTIKTSGGWSPLNSVLSLNDAEILLQLFLDSIQMHGKTDCVNDPDPDGWTLLDQAEHVYYFNEAIPILKEHGALRRDDLVMQRAPETQSHTICR